jgi:2-iminobutanoate/2-iminopropanoate deaminase
MKRVLILPVLLAIIAGTACKDKAEKKEPLRKIITLANTPEKRPYSPAVETGNMLFVAGQVAVDQETGKLIEGGIEEQTRQVLKNMKTIFEKAGYSMENVVKCTVLLTDISFYAPMNQVYMEFFPKDPPARMAFAVKDLPLGALVEIDAIAVK